MDERLRAVSARVRAERPLVHNITNHVVMNYTANALLAFGASPAMVHAVEEVEEFVALSRALVINIGTLDAGFVAGMLAAAGKAAALGVPWALDPVGVGATTYRNEVSARLLAMKPSVIRANAAETMALAGQAAAGQRGVDSLTGSEAAIEAGKALSKATGAVVAVTGATDFVISGDEVRPVAGGHALSQAVTGTGCTATALVGACLAVAPPAEAAEAALSALKQAAERAAATLSTSGAAGPGSFAVALIDALAE